MALDDPDLNKVLFHDFEKPKIIKTEIDKKAKLACVIIEPGRKPHVEIIECGPGVYRITAKQRNIPFKRWFQTECLESWMKKNV